MLRIQDPPKESKQEEVGMTLDGLARGVISTGYGSRAALKGCLVSVVLNWSEELKRLVPEDLL